MVDKADTDSYAVNVTETEDVFALEAAITSPTASEVISITNPTIQWTLVGGTQQSFQVQIAFDDDFDVLAYDSGTVASGTLAHTVPPGSILDGQTYHVRVILTDTTGLQIISESVQFTTDFPTSQDVENVTTTLFGLNDCDESLPAVRVRWDQVVPGAGETFVEYDIRRRIAGETVYTRIAIIETVSVVFYDDYSVEPGTTYEYSILWQADTVGGRLQSADQDPPQSAYLVFDYAWLHEFDNPVYHVRLPAYAVQITPVQGIVFNRAWGRPQPTAFVGEAFHRTIGITTLPQMRRSRALWTMMQAIMQRQATVGSVLVLRVGVDRARFFCHIASGGYSPVNEIQYEQSVQLQEVFYDETL